MPQSFFSCCAKVNCCTSECLLLLPSFRPFPSSAVLASPCFKNTAAPKITSFNLPNLPDLTQSTNTPHPPTTTSYALLSFYTVGHRVASSLIFRFFCINDAWLLNHGESQHRSFHRSFPFLPSHLVLFNHQTPAAQLNQKHTPSQHSLCELLCFTDDRPLSAHRPSFNPDLPASICCIVTELTSAGSPNFLIDHILFEFTLLPRSFESILGHEIQYPDLKLSYVGLCTHRIVASCQSTW